MGHRDFSQAGALVLEMAQNTQDDKKNAGETHDSLDISSGFFICLLMILLNGSHFIF